MHVNRTNLSIVPCGAGFLESIEEEENVHTAEMTDPSVIVIPKRKFKRRTGFDHSLSLPPAAYNSAISRKAP
jgi:hypothetical protein